MAAWHGGGGAGAWALQQKVLHALSPLVLPLHDFAFFARSKLEFLLSLLRVMLDFSRVRNLNFFNPYSESLHTATRSVRSSRLLHDFAFPARSLL